MQSKKEKSSAQREASDIQSTQARNEYILSLVAGNAHLEQYFTYDLPLLMQTVDDGALEKVKGKSNSESTINFRIDANSLLRVHVEIVGKRVHQRQRSSRESGSLCGKRAADVGRHDQPNLFE